MTNKILITYASRYNATAGVAKAIGSTLSELGAQVDVLPMRAVSDLSSYTAVVAGSPINGAAWLPEAMDFIRMHQAELAQRPFATFQVCMTLAMRNGNQYLSHVSSWLEPVRALVKPVSEGFFTGALDIRQITPFGTRLKFRMSVLLGVWTEGDHRDWDAIHAWAVQLKPLLTA